MNVASRMESHGQPGTVEVTQSVRDLLLDRFDFEARGSIEIKNRGHSLTIDSGWREVADTALAFVKRFS